MCHPPVGLNLYVASGITKMGITELTIAVWPWLLTMLVFLVIVTYWPWLTLCSAEGAGNDPVADTRAPASRTTPPPPAYAAAALRSVSPPGPPAGTARGAAVV
mgnify:CR=1 FL=1